MTFLTDLLPPAVRKYVYAILSAGLYLYSLYLATQGDWAEFAVSTASALVTSMATANVDVETDPETEEFVDEEPYEPLDSEGVPVE